MGPIWDTRWDAIIEFWIPPEIYNTKKMAFLFLKFY